MEKYRSVKYRNEVIVARFSARSPIRLKAVSRLAHFILKKLKFQNTVLSVIFVSDVAIKRLNRRYLKHSRVTDVLAFPFNPSSSKNLRNARSFLGEVVIAPRQAKVNAKRFAVSFEDELARYIAHGILHLNGLKDDSKAAQKMMRYSEDRLLKRFDTQIREIIQHGH
ncbi:MAG: rRNA maturation RNase YbeY [Candidatus Omnitrophica bacterium]|nr:rRNA maturation RNase YbeY [Candidatus Omnitrophota bacterium]